MWWVLPVMFSAVVSSVLGHGRVLVPPSRATAWRYGFDTPPDYDDDGANCGGFNTQWAVNGGKCGICGDAYNSKTPREHELGGKYGQGIIVAQYQAGSTVTISVQLTTSHLGFWQFKICPDPTINDQECFDKYLLELEDGGTKYYPTKGSVTYDITYKLPSGLYCEHCVLQWRYTAGNNWGICSNGTQGVGCGNQEQFGACSDISIGLSKSTDSLRSYGNIPYPLFYYLKHGYFDAQQGLLNLLRNGFVRPRQRAVKTAKHKKRRKHKKRKKNKHRKRKKVLFWKR